MTGAAKQGESAASRFIARAGFDRAYCCLGGPTAVVGRTVLSLCVIISIITDLGRDGPGTLIRRPIPPWNGDLNKVCPTHVNIARLGEVIAQVRTAIYDAYDAGVLRLSAGISANEARRRYTFTQLGAANEHVLGQHERDHNTRWGLP